MADLKMALINPPAPAHHVSLKDTMGGFGQLLTSECDTVMPTLDVLYTAALLRERGVSFDCIESTAMCLDLDDVLRRLSKNRFEFVAIRVSTPTIEWDLEVAHKIKEATHATLILFGPHIAVSPDGLLDHPSIDALVFGESEVTLTELAERGDLGATSGLWFRGDDRNIVKNPPRQRIEDLDGMPFPAWDLMPIANFRSGNMPQPFATMLTSRGCPHNCSYCPYPVSQGLQWRHRSALNVVAEMKWLETEFGVKSILFVILSFPSRNPERPTSVTKSSSRASRWRGDVRRGWKTLHPKS